MSGVKSVKDSFEAQHSVSNDVSIDFESFEIENACRRQTEKCYQQLKDRPVSKHDADLEKSILEKIHSAPITSQNACEGSPQNKRKRLCTEERINRCCTVALFKFFQAE